MANAGDRTDVEKAGKLEERRQARRLADWAFVMSDARGRRVVNEVLAETDMFGEIFNPNGSVTNLNLGKRRVGLFVYAALEQSCPEKVLLMRQEYIKDQGE